MLKTRVITALIGFGISIIAITMGGVVFNVLIAMLTLLGWREFALMIRNKKIYIPLPWGLLFSFLILLAISFQAYVYALIGVIAAIMVLGLLYIFGSSHNHFSLSTVAYSCFGLFYSLGGFGALMILRDNSFYEYLGLNLYTGTPAVLVIWLLMFCTWASDTFAYFAGRLWGKRKIVPNISPNKTLEGFIGGFIGCILTGIIFAYLTGLPILNGLQVGFLAGIFAPFGDLFESKIKRSCRVKDSGLLLPGHGGVLDRFDSLIFTAPLTFIYLLMEAL